MDGNGFVDLKEFKSLNLLQTATSMHGSTMRQARLADLILEEDGTYFPKKNIFFRCIF